MVCFNRRGQLQRLLVFFFPALAGGLHARCFHGGVNRVCEWVFRGLLSAGGCGGVFAVGQSGDPKAAAASLEERKGL